MVCDQKRDVNGLGVEHYAVDSGDASVLRHVLQRGGSVHARDHAGWTPLFRARLYLLTTHTSREYLTS
jgi:hypothetical protein